MDLIDRAALKKAWHFGDDCLKCEQDTRKCNYDLYYTRMDVCGMLDDAPTVDAVPVVHGRWEPSEKYSGYNKCSVCADCYIDPEWAMNGKWHYCPNCGAKMDGEEW